MEKLICNKNLASSAKVPPFLSKASKVPRGTGQEVPNYSSRHFLFLFLTGGGQRTARIASSNTVLRPRCVRAEHSRYLTAPAEKHSLLQTSSNVHTNRLLQFEQGPSTRQLAHRATTPPPPSWHNAGGALLKSKPDPRWEAHTLYLPRLDSSLCHKKAKCKANMKTAGLHTNLFSHGQALWVGNGGQLLLLQFLDRVFIIPKVKFGPHQDDGSVGTMMSHFRVPLDGEIRTRSWHCPLRASLPELPLHRCQALPVTHGHQPIPRASCRRGYPALQALLTPSRTTGPPMALDSSQNF